MGIPRPKHGELKISFGKLAGHDPDIIVASGSGTARADRSLLMNAITSKTHSPIDDSWRPSLVDELQSRGYDLSTLRISIAKPTDFKEPNDG